MLNVPEHDSDAEEELHQELQNPDRVGRVSTTVVVIRTRDAQDPRPDIHGIGIRKVIKLAGNTNTDAGKHMKSSSVQGSRTIPGGELGPRGSAALAGTFATKLKLRPANAHTRQAKYHDFMGALDPNAWQRAWPGRSRAQRAELVYLLARPPVPGYPNPIFPLPPRMWLPAKLAAKVKGLSAVQRASIETLAASIDHREQEEETRKYKRQSTHACADSELLETKLPRARRHSSHGRLERVTSQTDLDLEVSDSTNLTLAIGRNTAGEGLPGQEVPAPITRLKMSASATKKVSFSGHSQLDQQPQVTPSGAAAALRPRAPASPPPGPRRRTPRHGRSLLGRETAAARAPPLDREKEGPFAPAPARSASLPDVGAKLLRKWRRSAAMRGAGSSTPAGTSAANQRTSGSGLRMGNAGSQYFLKSDESGIKLKKTFTRKTMFSKSRKKLSSGRKRSLAQSVESQSGKQKRISETTPPVGYSSEGEVGNSRMEHGGSGDNQAKEGSTNLDTKVGSCETNTMHTNYNNAAAVEHEHNSRTKWGVLGSASDIVARAHEHLSREPLQQATSTPAYQEIENQNSVTQQEPSRHSSESMSAYPTPSVQSSLTFGQPLSGVYAIPALGRFVPFSNTPQDPAQESPYGCATKDAEEGMCGRGGSDPLNAVSDPSSRSSVVNPKWPGLEELQALSKQWQHSNTDGPAKVSTVSGCVIPAANETGDLEMRVEGGLSHRQSRNSELLVESEWWQATPLHKVDTNLEGGMRIQSGRNLSSDARTWDGHGGASANKKQRPRSGVDLGSQDVQIAFTNGEAKEDCKAEESPAGLKLEQKFDVHKNSSNSDDKTDRVSQHSVSQDATNTLLSYSWMEDDAPPKPGHVADDTSASRASHRPAMKPPSGRGVRWKKTRRRVGFRAAVASALVRRKDSEYADQSADTARSTTLPLLEIPPFRSKDLRGSDREMPPTLTALAPPALKLPSVRRHLKAHQTSFPDTESGKKSRFHSSRSLSVMVSMDRRWTEKSSGEGDDPAGVTAGASLCIPESAEPDLAASPARSNVRSARRRDDAAGAPPVGTLPAKQMLSKDAYCDVRRPGNGKWEAVVGTPTRFCLLTHDTRGGRPVRAQDFTVWFKSGECVLQATLSYIDTNVFGVDWLATAVGQMGINVLIDNRPVIGAPFFVDVQPVIPTPQFSYVVGEDITTPVAGKTNTIEVLVCDQFANLCSRGGTPLLVSIEGPDNINNITIHDKDNGTYSVTYTLRKAGDYTLNLQLATGTENEHIHGSPFYLCARPGPYYFLKTRVHPSSLETECGVDLVMYFSLRDKNMNPCTTGASGPIQVTIMRKSDQAHMDVEVVDCQDGSYRVDYSAPLSGEYSLQIIHNGVRRFDPPKTITVHGGQSVPSKSYIIGPDRDSASKVHGAVGEKRIFFVQLVDIHGNKKSDDKPEKVAAMIEYNEESDGSRHVLEANMIDVDPAPNGQYQVSWQGKKIGSYFIHVTLDGEPVSGSPLKAQMTRGQVCIEQCEIVVESDQLMAPIAGEQVHFRVQAKDMYSNNVRIGGVEFQLIFELDDKELGVRKTIDPLIDSDLKVESVVDNRDGTYSFAYTALKADTMQMHVVTRASGRSILGSPFLVSVSAAHIHIPSSTITLEDTEVVAGRFCDVEVLAVDMFGNLQVSGIEAFTVTMELCEDCAATSRILPVLPGACGSQPGKSSSIRRTVVLDPNKSKPKLKAPTSSKWSSFARPSPRIMRVASTLIQADPSGLELHIQYEGKGKYCIKYKASFAGRYQFTIASTRETNSELCKTFEVTVLPASIQAHNCKLEYAQAQSIAGEPCIMTLYAHDQFGNRIYKGGAEVKWTVQNEMLANSKNMRRLKLQMKAKQIHANRSAKSQLGWGGGVAALAEELVMQMEEDADDDESSEDEVHHYKDSDTNPKAEQSPSAKLMSIGTMCKIANAVGILQRTRSDLSLPVFLKSISNDNQDGTYQMETRAKRSGSYLVSFSVNGEVHPKQTKVQVSAGPVDISRCTLLGAGLEDGTAGVLSRFTIKAKDRYSNQVETGGEKFSVFLKPDKCKDRQTISFVRGQVVDNDDGTYSAEFLPVLAGRHVLLVSHVGSRQTFYKDVISIKPSDPDASTCEVAGYSLHQAALGCTAQLSLLVRDRFGNLCSMGDEKQTRLACIIEGPSGVIDVRNHSNVYEAPDCHAGIYLFTYTPHEIGSCRLHLTVDGTHVKGSPFPLKVVEGLVDMSDFTRKIDNIQQHMGTSLASGWDRMWLPESGQQYETEEMDARLGVPSYLSSRPWNPTTAHLLSISGPRVTRRAAQSIEDREKALAKYERYLVRKRVTIMHAGICSLLPSAEEVKYSARESTSGEQAMIPHKSDPIPPAEANSSLSKSPRSARRHLQVFDPEKYLQLIAKR